MNNSLRTTYRWNKDNDELLITMLDKLPRKEVADVMGCSLSVIDRQSKRLGINRTKVVWEPSWDANLIKLHSLGLTINELVLEIGVSRASLQNQMKRLSLYKITARNKELKLIYIKPVHWKVSWDKELKEMYTNNISVFVIAKHFNVSVTSVYRRAGKLKYNRRK
jgi:hypothetical protein